MTANKKMRTAVYIGIAVLLLLLNCLTPMVGDDYQYSFIFNRPERIESLADVFYSQYIHYFEWGGRSVAHFLLQFFLLLGKPVFNVFNTGVTLLYLYLIAKLAGERKVRLWIFVSAFLLSWFFMPQFGTVFFWLTGSCNYLWTAVIMFALIGFYYSALERGRQLSLVVSLLIGLWGVAAGWCNENTSGMTVFCALALTGYYWYKYRKIQLWQISGIVGGTIGFLFMILAPGNYIRASRYDGLNIVFWLHKNWMQANAVTFDAEGKYAVIFAAFLITFFVMMCLKVDREKKIIGTIWVVAAFLGNYAMILSPKYPPRASFGVRTMFVISILYCVSLILQKTAKDAVRRYLPMVVLLTAGLYFLCSYAEALYDVGGTWWKDRERVQMVYEEKEKGNLSIEVPKMNAKTEYNVFYNILDWPSYDVEKYFGMDEIRAK